MHHVVVMMMAPVVHHHVVVMMAHHVMVHRGGAGADGAERQDTQGQNHTLKHHGRFPPECVQPQQRNRPLLNVRLR